jgi:biofilm PGA synthesis N-glycosyltransferase PgaC
LKKTTPGDATGAGPLFPVGGAAAAAETLTAHDPVSPGSPSIGWYLPVRVKFALALAVAVAWLALSVWLALVWIRDLSILVGPFLAWMAVGGIALVPGFMNAFLAASLLVDRRPGRRRPAHLPAISLKFLDRLDEIPL